MHCIRFACSFWCVLTRYPVYISLAQKLFSKANYIFHLENTFELKLFSKQNESIFYLQTKVKVFLKRK